MSVNRGDEAKKMVDKNILEMMVSLGNLLKTNVTNVDVIKLSRLVDELEGKIASHRSYMRDYESIQQTDHPDYKMQMKICLIYERIVKQLYEAIPCLQRDLNLQK